MEMDSWEILLDREDFALQRRIVSELSVHCEILLNAPFTGTDVQENVYL